MRLYPLPFLKLKSCLCIEGQHDSRAYKRWDIVIFNTKLTEGNGIYVVSVGSTFVAKRVDFDTSNRAIILISANPAYEPRRFSGYELDNIRA